MFPMTLIKMAISQGTGDVSLLSTQFRKDVFLYVCFFPGGNSFLSSLCDL